LGGSALLSVHSTHKKLPPKFLRGKMKIAIDPGSRATGVVAFVGGGAVSTTFYPRHKIKGFWAKTEDMVDRLFIWLEDLEKKHKQVITTIAVEEFIKHVPRMIASRLKRLFEFLGYLKGRLRGFCDSRGADLVDVCKGRAPKEEALLVARAHGFEGRTQHEIDAFHLGLLAGFYCKLS